MRLIVTFILILAFIKITHIDKLVWPAVQGGFSVVNHMVQGAK